MTHLPFWSVNPVGIHRLLNSIAVDLSEDAFVLFPNDKFKISQAININGLLIVGSLLSKPSKKEC